MTQRLSPAQLADYYIDLYERTGECLIWRGSKSGRGYGQKWVNRRRHPVHRLAWEEAYGPVPAGLVLKHACDQKLCYRLDHLELGTYHGNAREAIERGQLRRGKEHSNARLTEADVLAIRASTLNQRSTAREFGVSQMTVSRVRSRKAWGHVL